MSEISYFGQDLVDSCLSVCIQPIQAYYPLSCFDRGTKLIDKKEDYLLLPALWLSDQNNPFNAPDRLSLYI